MTAHPLVLAQSLSDNYQWACKAVFGSIEGFIVLVAHMLMSSASLAAGLADGSSFKAVAEKLLGQVQVDAGNIKKPEIQLAVATALAAVARIKA
eukprot:jgi/Chrzof1/7765/Cz02g35270.t1